MTIMEALGGHDGQTIADVLGGGQTIMEALGGQDGQTIMEALGGHDGQPILDVIGGQPGETIADRIVKNEDDPEPQPGEKIKKINNALAKASEAAAYFAEHVYNQKGKNNTLDRSNDNDVAEHYYVAVAKNVPANAAVSINNTVHAVDSKSYLSVGGNSFVYDVDYYVDGGICYVAFPLVIFEGDIVINDVKVVPAKSKTNTMAVQYVGIHGNGGSNVVDNGDNNYTVNMRSRTDYLEFKFEGVAAEDLLVTYKDVTSDGKKSVSYGFSTADVIDGAYGIWMYPFGWAGDDAAWDAIADTRMFVYTVLVAGKNTIATVNLDCRKGSAIAE